VTYVGGSSRDLSQNLLADTEEIHENYSSWIRFPIRFKPRSSWKRIKDVTNLLMKLFVASALDEYWDIFIWPVGSRGCTMLPTYLLGTDYNFIVLYELPRTIQHMRPSEFIEQNVARLYTQPIFRIL